jgi:hypothetical protein
MVSTNELNTRDESGEPAQNAPWRAKGRLAASSGIALLLKLVSLRMVSRCSLEAMKFYEQPFQLGSYWFQHG